MKWLALAPTLLLSVAAYACSGSVTTIGGNDGGDASTGGGASSGTTSSSGSAGGGTSGSSSGTGGSTSGAASSGGSTGSSGSSGSTGSSGSIGAGCGVPPGCPNGEICGFPTANGCSAQGTCFPPPGAICQAYSPGCACDGTEINTICNGLPSGYETKPLAHTGACAAVDAGGGCTSDTQCGTGMKCCYPCGIPGCTNTCMSIPAGGSCPHYP